MAGETAVLTNGRGHVIVTDGTGRYTNRDIMGDVPVEGFDRFEEVAVVKWGLWPVVDTDGTPRPQIPAGRVPEYEFIKDAEGHRVARIVGLSELVKSGSNCGANAPGGGGFQSGNTCAAGGGGGGSGEVARGGRAELEDNPEKYFDPTDTAQRIPVDKLVPLHEDADATQRALGHMQAAARGENGRRPPILVQAHPDGTYHILDGNSTTAAAKQGGLSEVYAEVRPALRDDPDLYFDNDEHGSRTQRIPVDKLVPTNKNRDNIRRALDQMHAAANGESPGREPLKVQDMGDGTYEVLNGNATTNAARLAGLTEVYADVRPRANAENLETYFDPEDVAPEAKSPLRNRQRTQQEIFETAARELPEFRKTLNHGTGLDLSLGAEPVEFGDAVERTKSRLEKPLVVIAPLKGIERSTEKVMNKYNGDWSQLTDVVRGTVVVESIDDIPAVVAQLEDHLEERGWDIAPQSVTSRFRRPTGAGYRDLQVALQTKSGLLAELQINTRAMFRAKEDGHKLYKEYRSIVERPDVSPEDRSRAEQLERSMVELYSRAFEESGGAIDKVKSWVAKSSQTMSALARNRKGGTP